MTRRLSLRPLALAAPLAAALATVAAAPAPASAGGYVIRAGGGVHVHAHVHVGGAVGVGYGYGYVRPRPYYYRPYYARPYYYGGVYVRFAEPPPPPCAYGCYYGGYTESVPAATVTATPVAPPEPALPAFALGAFVGSTDVENQDAGSDVGLNARLRLSPHFLAEAEVAKTEMDKSTRVDRRLGAGLIYDFSPWSTFSPYLVGAFGVGKSEMDGSTVTAHQTYGELGVGLEWRLSSNFSLLGDLRAGGQHNRYQDGGTVALVRDPGATPSQDDEHYTRARLGAMLSF